MKTHSTSKREPSFIGIDYHKHYRVYCVIDAHGEVLERGRVEHVEPGRFGALVKRWQGCRVVFEASMNWHWLYEVLETEMAAGDIGKAKGVGPIKYIFHGRGLIHRLRRFSQRFLNVFLIS